MSKCRMVIIMFMESVRIGMVTTVVLFPAVDGPVITFPSVIPMTIFSMVIMFIIFCFSVHVVYMIGSMF